MNNIAVKYGLIIGGVSIGILLAKYLIDPKLVFTTLNLWSLFATLITLALLYIAATKVRAQKGGLITFGEAFKSTFITYLVSAFMGMFAFTILMFLIDPSLQDIAAEAQIEASEKTMRFMGASENEILEASEQLEEMEVNPILNFFIGFINAALFFGLPISAVIGAIVKRTPKQTA